MGHAGEAVPLGDQHRGVGDRVLRQPAHVRRPAPEDVHQEPAADQRGRGNAHQGKSHILQVRAGQRASRTAVQVFV